MKWMGWIVIVVAHLLLLLAGMGLGYDYGSRIDWSPAAPTAVPVSEAKFSEQLRLAGILEARDIRPVYAGVSGTVEWMIDEGTEVTPETTIIKFDPTDLQKSLDSKELELDQNTQNFVQQFRYAQRNKELQRLTVVSALMDVEQTCIARDLAMGLPIGSSWRETAPDLPPVPDFNLWKMQGSQSILDTLTDPIPVPKDHSELLEQADAPVPALAQNVIDDHVGLAQFRPAYLSQDLQAALDGVFAPPQEERAQLATIQTARKSESDRRWAAEDLGIAEVLEKQGLQSLQVLQTKQQAQAAADLTAQRDRILDELNLIGADDSVRRQSSFALLRQTLEYKKAVKDAESQARNIDLNLLSYKLKVDASAIDLRNLQKQLKDADTKPPISGIVAYVDIWKGSDESLSPLQIGDTRNRFWDLCKIADTSSLRVRVVLDESDYSRVHVNQPAVVRLPSFPEVELKGEVEQIQAYAEDRNAQLSPLALVSRGQAFVQSFEVYIKLVDIPPKIKARLRLGLTAEVDIERGKEHSGLAVTPNAIDFNAQDQPVVYVKNPGDTTSYTVRRVEIGNRTPERVELLPAPGAAALKAGDELMLPAAIHAQP
ncbi:MAG: efflux RND transporter periplasmic adaptor subunit [Planctomycetota bacterium]